MDSKLIAGAASGSIFGAALAASGVYAPSVIVSQMKFQDFHMLKVFLGASAASSLLIVIFDRLGLAKCTPRTPSSLGRFGKYDGNIIGGLLIGTGMTLTGACPGTSIVQVAAGLRSGVFVVLGGILGGIVYVRAESILRRKEVPASSAQQINTVYEKLEIGRTAAVLTYEALCLAVIATAILLGPTQQPSLLHSTAGALLIAGAQAFSLLMRKNLIGVSTAYQEIGQAFWQTVRSTFGIKSIRPAAVPLGSVTFALGVLAGSWTLFSAVPSLQVKSDIQVSAIRALAGGFAMAFGARTAGGCTSGHGLSGMSMLSVSSVISVVSMFAGGMGLALFL